MRTLSIAVVVMAASSLSLAAQRPLPARRPAPPQKSEELKLRQDAQKYQKMLARLELEQALLKNQHTDRTLLDEHIRSMLDQQHIADLEIRSKLLEQQQHLADERIRAKLLEQPHMAQDAHLKLLEPQEWAGHYEKLMAEAARSASEYAHLFGSQHAADFEAELDRLSRNAPRESWAAQDPADSLWRAARNRLNSGQYQEAMRLFSRIRTEERFARSVYRPDAFYYEAFSLARIGGEDNLRLAQEILGQLMRRYPANQRHADTQSLLTTIQVRLAESYRNAPAEVAVRALADEVRYATTIAPVIANAASAVEAVSQQWPTVAVTPPLPFFRSPRHLNPQCAQDAEIRLIALNALVRMDSTEAMPVLREVMARRDECAPVLRERALMIVSRIKSPEAENMLFDAARNDPDRGIRQSALVWLSSRNADRALSIAEEQLRTAQNSEDQEWALEALARMRNERAWRAIRDYAARSDLRVETRRRAIAQLSQSQDSVNASFLRDLYTRVGNERELKEAILMSSAARRGSLDSDWLLSIAHNEGEDLRLREYALNLVGRSRAVTADRVVSTYDRLTEKRLKMVAIRSLSERARNDAVATEKLIAIARSETDMDLRKSAVTGLTSVNDPRARELLMEILRR